MSGFTIAPGQWPTFNWASVLPGDTVVIQGTHYCEMHLANAAAPVKVSGGVGAPINIVGDNAAIIGARRLMPAQFTTLTGGAFSATIGANKATMAWQGNPLGPGPKLLVPVSSLAYCQVQEGSFWWDTVGKKLIVHPWNESLDEIYYDAKGALRLNANSHLNVENIKLFGGAPSIGVLYMRKVESNSITQTNVSIRNCEIAFGENTGLFCQGGNTTFINFEGNKIHHVPAGMYPGTPPSGATYNHRNWSVRYNEVWSGQDTTAIFTTEPGDGQAIGGQNLTDSCFNQNYIHDFWGSGIMLWISDEGLGRNNRITVNTIKNLTDPINKGYHHAIDFGGSNDPTLDERTTGLLIQSNVIDNCRGDQTLAYGAGYGIRLKPGNSVLPTCPRISDNLITNCDKKIVTKTFKPGGENPIYIDENNP